MNYKAILFDMDGTLLDTLGDIANSMNTVLGNKGLPVHPLESYREFIGDGIEHLVRLALPESLRINETISECVKMMREEYSRTWMETTCLYNGISELLTHLANQGIRFSILSNKPDEFTKKMAQHYLSSWKFEYIYGALPDYPRKPDPALALKIADAMKLNPAQLLYLGDTSTDMKTAVAAGMFPVGVLWGFRYANELLSTGAKELVDKPGDLVRIISE